MNKEIIYSFTQTIKRFGDNAYIKAVLIYNISPVLEGIKPASIITFSRSGRNLKRLWKLYGKSLIKNNEIKYLELYEGCSSISIMFYNCKLLERLMGQGEIRDFYKELGYRFQADVEFLLAQMKFKYQKECPHEIGVLLGIPLEDVKSFMDERNQECLAAGYWKVYNNLEEALNIFKTYDQIRERAIYDIIQNGISN